MSDVIFILFSATALVSALLAVTRRNPIYATVWMLSSMSSLAGIYVLLESPFLGIIQILLYAGAILVLFVFVIMLLNQSSDEVMNDAPPMVQRVVATCVAVALLVGMTLGTFSDGFGGDFSKVPEGSQVALLDRSERLAGESGVAAAVPAAPEPAVQG
ncbi:MAG: NADH-quinone oxidoreductase subunit J family protein, partial [Planctomycetota bacterium]